MSADAPDSGDQSPLEHSAERERALVYLVDGGTLLVDDNGVLGDAIRAPSPYLLAGQERTLVQELIDAGLARRDDSGEFPLTDDGRRWVSVAPTAAGRALLDQWAPPQPDPDEQAESEALDEIVAATVARLGRPAGEHVITDAVRSGWSAAMTYARRW